MTIPVWASLSGEEKRERTLAAADELFAREGLDVAMPVLAAAIGAGVGSIYRMVGAKEDVIAALVIKRALGLVERFTAACDERDAWAALQRVTYVTAQDGATDFLSQTAWDDAADRRGASRGGIAGRPLRHPPERAFRVREEDREAVEGRRILVVDDEPDARDLVRQLLGECGATVDVAESATAALAHLAANHYDVVVSDIGMPHEDGHALIRRIRTQDPGGNGAVPAIALTAYARGEDIAKAMAAGFQLHAPKPLEPGVLISLVAALARGRAPLSA